MLFRSFVMSPVARLLTTYSRILNRVFGDDPRRGLFLSREEIRAAIPASRGSDVTSSERMLIRKILDSSHRTAAADPAMQAAATAGAQTAARTGRPSLRVVAESRLGMGIDAVNQQLGDHLPQHSHEELLLRAVGQTPDQPVVSTSEAVQIAANRAPGIGRAFGFEKLANFDAKAWEGLRNAAYGAENNSIKTNIYGSDLRGDALALTRANLDELDLLDKVTLKQANVFEMPAPAATGIIVTNPPYGVRLEDRDALAAFYPKLGDTLKQKFSGWTAYILSSDMALAKRIGLAASKRTPLFNGALECRLFEYKLVAGSMRTMKPEAAPG